MDSQGEVPPWDTEKNEDERAGLYLAFIAAFAVPGLIILAFFLPAGPISSTFDSDAREPPATGLDRIELSDRRSNAEPPEVEVEGAGERRERVDVQIGDAESIESTNNSTDAIAPLVTTTTAPSTTTTTTPATTTTTELQEPAAFARRVDLGRIGDSTLQFRFASVRDTAYVVTVRAGSTTVSSFSGRASAGVLVNESATGLTPGTDHTLEVTLSGPPPASSPQVAFRPSGGDAPEPNDTPARIESFRIVEVGPTRFEVRYDSNICANGSFVIRELDGTVVGRNAGQAAGCTTRHLAIPGLWTAPLEPNTTYTITMQIEANGAGRGDGNTASRSITVTTTS
ncbi:MAG: hypothetical protein ACI81L_001800 [Verrucomicrobiales bacterium]